VSNAKYARRDVLRLTGLGAATAAVAVACGEHARGQVGRVGTAATTTTLPEAVVTNATLLRTASGIEHSIIAVYEQIIGKSDLLDAKYTDMATRFRDDHTAAAKTIEDLTTAAGGEAWSCGNPKFDDVVVTPVMTRITKGAEATATSKAVEASDDPHRDILNFIHGLESLGGAMYQSFVPMFTEPELRSKGMAIAVQEARHAALLALTINTDRPAGLVNFTDAVNAEPAAPPTTLAATTTTQNIANIPSGGAATQPPPQQTEIPTITAIPGAFGNLAALPLVVGRGDENGTRLKLNLETPSLNSFVYEYMKPTCSS
jgi:hypothetical protein